MLDFFSKKKIMIVVAHPDDELLGLGATMNKLIEEFEVVTRVVILGEGITSRADTHDRNAWEQELKIHKDNIEQARTCIGYHEVSTYDFPDNRFDSVPILDIIKVIEREKNDFLPNIIFTHHGGDLNIDHQITFESVITACRPMSEESVSTVITFETPSGTEWRANSDPRHFLPNLFISVAEKNIKAKINGMESYQYEKRVYPHPRSPEALRIQAQRWGISVGRNFAEAFQIIRTIY